MRGSDPQPRKPARALHSVLHRALRDPGEEILDVFPFAEEFLAKRLDVPIQLVHKANNELYAQFISPIVKTRDHGGRTCGRDISTIRSTINHSCDGAASGLDGGQDGNYPQGEVVCGFVKGRDERTMNV